MTGWTYHGGRLAEARARFGDAAGPWLDLSTGINPHPWPGAGEVAIDWRSLPDEQGLHDLECAAAACFGVDPVHVTALPGTEIGLRLLGKLLPGPARYQWPSYRTHAAMFADSTVMAEGAGAGAASGITILANPNNPDGAVHTTSQLLALLQETQREGGTLVVDEAFADADPGLSLAGHVRDDKPLILFRSFGKFFGLAGVRLGFMIGPSAVIACVRATLGAWPVSSAAIAIGAAAYRNHRWIAAMRAQLRSEAEALDMLLRGHGLRPMGACPLYRLIEVEDAASLFRRLAQGAILTRPFDYNPRWLRLGLPSGGDALSRLDRALADG
jgi:cobalamin biosynthetic protein CobC